MSLAPDPSEGGKGAWCQARKCRMYEEDVVRGGMCMSHVGLSGNEEWVELASDYSKLAKAVIVGIPWGFPLCTFHSGLILLTHNVDSMV